ncbi:MAG TPA: peptidoglycan-binding domain-containing protein [Stellaceae bacterium]|nr:peptidoglycan-binding domain-containing protein [Stellaceae bacterium]
MKRVLLATSLIALSMGSVAFAQSGAGSMGSGTNGASAQSTNAGGMNGSNSTGTTGSSMNGSGANAGPMADSASTARSGMGHMSSSNVRQAQEALKSQGLYHGRVDGKMGPMTRTAVSKFQKEKGMKQTAQLDRATMSGLQGSDMGGGMDSGDHMSSSPSNSGSMNKGMNNNGAGATSGSSMVPASPTTMPKSNPGPTQPGN